MGINFDDSNFKAGVKKALEQIENNTKKACSDVATEILRYSQHDVPHNIGTLQNSGNIEPVSPSLEMTVGYNTPYAARLHEHPEYHFQKGRKGKYLEDPIKAHLSEFKQYFANLLGGGK